MSFVKFELCCSKMCSRYAMHLLHWWSLTAFQVELGPFLFDVVATLMYNLSDARRHWKNYLSNTKLVPVPSLTALSTFIDNKPGSALPGTSS